MIVTPERYPRLTRTVATVLTVGALAAAGPRIASAEPLAQAPVASLEEQSTFQDNATFEQPPNEEPEATKPIPHMSAVQAIGEVTTSSVVLTVPTYDFGKYQYRVRCNGTRVSVKDPLTKRVRADVAYLAGHCAELDEEKLGKNNANVGKLNRPAYNLIDVTFDDYFIASPKNINKPLARVNGFATTTSTSETWEDGGMVSFKPINNPAAKKALNAIKPTDASNFGNPELQPNPGERVYLYGPNGQNPKPTQTSGRYMGQTWHIWKDGNTTKSALVDIVTIPKASPARDACFWGASGKSAVARTAYRTGPLMWHVAKGDAELQKKLGFFSDNPATAKKRFNSAKNWTRDTLAMLERNYPDRTTPNATYCLFRATPSGEPEQLAEALHRDFPLKKAR